MTAFHFAHLGYLVSIVLFIFGIKRLSKIKTARSANALAAGAMLIAVVSQLVELGTVHYTTIFIAVLAGGAIGGVLAYVVQMTRMPQLVAVFNGFGGAASVLVALSLFTAAEKGRSLAEISFQGASGYGTAITLVLSIVIGAITLSGSLMAYLKLSEKFGGAFDKPILLPARHAINACLFALVIGLCCLWIGQTTSAAISIMLAGAVTVLALACGVLLVVPIGGADMPVVISLLNSYSGLAASATGFALGSNVLIVSGSLVGASGMILTSIMCRGMNRTLGNVMIGGFGMTVDMVAGGAVSEYHSVRSADSEEAALDFDAAQSVIIVPGYGLAVAQGQNALAEFAGSLKKQGIKVRYAIHPVAGRMPGHMNVLLAESNIPYDELFEMDEINKDFRNTDIVLVVGANDVVNPAAKDDRSSPLYGMPVLNVEEATRVFVIKRSLSPGFAGVKNELFEKENCLMIYGDAKKILEELSTQFALALAA